MRNSSTFVSINTYTSIHVKIELYINMLVAYMFVSFLGTSIIGCAVIWNLSLLELHKKRGIETFLPHTAFQLQPGKFFVRIFLLLLISMLKGHAFIIRWLLLNKNDLLHELVCCIYNYFISLLYP